MGTFDKNRFSGLVVIVMLVSRLLILMIFGYEFGCLGLENKAFGIMGIANLDFRRNWISHGSWDQYS